MSALTKYRTLSTTDLYGESKFDYQNQAVHLLQKSDPNFFNMIFSNFICHVLFAEIVFELQLLFHRMGALPQANSFYSHLRILLDDKTLMVFDFRTSQPKWPWTDGNQSCGLA